MVRNKISSTGKAPDQNAPITEHLAYLLAQANREINRQLEERLGKEGVPVEQWRILKVLSDGSGRSMGELADAVLLNHPTLTKMIDRMVSDGLVYRVQDPNDRRKVLMFSSDRGRALCKRLNSLAVSQEAKAFEYSAIPELVSIFDQLQIAAIGSLEIRVEAIRDLLDAAANGWIVEHIDDGPVHIGNRYFGLMPPHRPGTEDFLRL